MAAVICVHIEIVIFYGNGNNNTVEEPTLSPSYIADIFQFKTRREEYNKPRVPLHNSRVQ